MPVLNIILLIDYAKPLPQLSKCAEYFFSLLYCRNVLCSIFSPSIFAWPYLKGQCHEIFVLFFFIKQLLLVSITHSRSYSYRHLLPGVFTIGELRLPGVFIIGESWLPSVFITGELRPPVYLPPASQPKLVYKRILLVQNTLGSQDSPVLNTLGSLDSMVAYSPEIFFVNLFSLFWCLFKMP